MARRRIRVGDVFTLPLDEDRVGFGQVVARYKKDGYFFAVFDRAYSHASTPDPGDVLTCRLLFLALSLDAKLHVGHWVIVGNEPVSPTLPLPAYKEAVGTPENVHVVDFAGERRRRATAEEAAALPNRTVVSPALLEKAFRAKHGLEPWHERFDGLEPPEEWATSSRCFDA